MDIMDCERTEKVLSLKNIYEDLPKDCDEAMLEWNKFLIYIVWEQSLWSWTSRFSWGGEKSHVYNYCTSNHRALQFLIDNDYLKPKEPGVITMSDMEPGDIGIYVDGIQNDRIGHIVYRGLNHVYNLTLRGPRTHWGLNSNTIKVRILKNAKIQVVEED